MNLDGVFDSATAVLNNNTVIPDVIGFYVGLPFASCAATAKMPAQLISFQAHMRAMIVPLGQPVNDSAALKRITPAATETFKDSFLPCIGISTTSSHCFNSAGETPETSFPKRIATGNADFHLA